MITARQAADTFLSPQEIATLTGVRIGKDGKTREQLQVASLRKMKIPHYVNAADRPIVAAVDQAMERDESYLPNT